MVKSQLVLLSYCSISEGVFSSILLSSFFQLLCVVVRNRLVNPSRDFGKRIILLLLKCINIRLWPEINIGLKFRGTCLCPVLNSYLISSSLVVLLFFIR